MDVVGIETAGERDMRADERRFKVVSMIAAAVAVPFVIGHLAFALWVVPTFAGMFRSMGGELPGATRLLVDLSGSGALALLFVVFDVAVFALMYVLAKRYWIGLLFVPLALYLGATAMLLPVLYMPMYATISLVE